MPEYKGPYIDMSPRQSTPQKKQFPLLANILAIITPKDNVSHQALQILDSGVVNIDGLSLPWVIHSRTPEPINAHLALGTSYTQPDRVGPPALGHITKRVRKIGKVQQVIETLQAHAMVRVKYAE